MKSNSVSHAAPQACGLSVNLKATTHNTALCSHLPSIHQYANEVYFCITCRATLRFGKEIDATTRDHNLKKPARVWRAERSDIRAGKQNDPYCHSS